MKQMILNFIIFKSDLRITTAGSKYGSSRNKYFYAKKEANFFHIIEQKKVSRGTVVNQALLFLNWSSLEIPYP